MRDETFHQDVARLVRALRAEPEVRQPSTGGDAVGSRRDGGDLAVALVAGGAWWASRDHGGDGGGTVGPVPGSASGTGWHEIAVDPGRTADLAYESGGSLDFAVNAAVGGSGTASGWSC